MTLGLDTLALARQLRDGGFQDRQAETLAAALGTATAAADVATRSDLDGVSRDLRSEIKLIAAELRAEMKLIAAELRTEIQRQTIRLGVTLVTVVGIALAIAKVLWP